MKTFEFYVDQKVTTWMRTKFTIDAEDIDVARQKSVDAVIQGDIDEYPWDEVMDTKEIMSISDNGGSSTIELFEEDGIYVWVNGEDKNHE